VAEGTIAPINETPEQSDADLANQLEAKLKGIPECEMLCNNCLRNSEADLDDQVNAIHLDIK
jgi:hypothetical protein